MDPDFDDETEGFRAEVRGISYNQRFLLPDQVI